MLVLLGQIPSRSKPEEDFEVRSLESAKSFPQATAVSAQGRALRSSPLRERRHANAAPLPKVRFNAGAGSRNCARANP